MSPGTCHLLLTALGFRDADRDFCPVAQRNDSESSRPPPAFRLMMLPRDDERHISRYKRGDGHFAITQYFCRRYLSQDTAGLIAAFSRENYDTAALCRRCRYGRFRLASQFLYRSCYRLSLMRVAMRRLLCQLSPCLAIIDDIAMASSRYLR